MRSLVILSLLPITVAAACSQQGVSPPVPSNGSAPSVRTRPHDRVHPQQSFSTIHFFTGADGANPRAGVKDWNGNLYGTTENGGAGSNAAGTVFELRQGNGGFWTERLLHTFGASGDGFDPQSDVTIFNNIAFGTTVYGGTSLVGTIYSVGIDNGVEGIVYNFKGADGKLPVGGLTQFGLGSQLVGTTAQGGGANDYGTVFGVDPVKGVETYLYRFQGKPDGITPFAGVTALDGDLYGTTTHGGDNDEGVVYKLSADGKESVLYSFKGRPSGDGAHPFAGLTVWNGVLYGVTADGGTNDLGTVFKIDKNGTESAVYSFKGADGKHPYGGLVVGTGNTLLYGTTSHGGPNDDGVIFTIDSSNSFAVVHEFSGGYDGKTPYGNLLELNGGIYGTTHDGGSGGRGTVFQLR
jgi:uncharacterized repeat protein (TIGR03803 family)